LSETSYLLSTSRFSCSAVIVQLTNPSIINVAASVTFESFPSFSSFSSPSVPLHVLLSVLNRISEFKAERDFRLAHSQSDARAVRGTTMVISISACGADELHQHLRRAASRLVRVDDLNWPVSQDAYD
jgi:hypothetical protein